MIEWEYTSQDTWEAHHNGIDFVVTRIREGDWYYEVLAVENIITGPYPGSPDWIEHAIAEGHVFSQNGDRFCEVTAKWLAERGWARWTVMMDVEADLENEYLAEMERDAARDWEGEYMASEEAMLDARTED